MALSDERASDIMEMLPPDEAADVLGDLEEERAERILHLMEPEEAEEVRELLRYPDDTAGGRMTPEYLAFTRSMTASQALAELRAQAPDAETIYYVYVTDAEEHLEGVLSLRDLITAEDETPLADLVQRDVIRVSVEDDQETVARLLNHYHLLAIPVVDANNVLHGIVTVDDVLDVLHEEAREDISRMSGATEESDLLATPWERMGPRLPWLLVTALAGLLIAYVLGLGNQMPRPLLALLPLLLLVGVQIGGQGAAVVQVAISEEEEWSDILDRLLHYQWRIGLIVSVFTAVVGCLFAALTDSHAHPLQVGAVLLGVLLVAMVVGSLLPLLLQRLHWDPTLVNRPALAILTLLLGVPLLLLVL